MKYIQQLILAFTLIFSPLFLQAADKCTADPDMVKLIKDLVAHPNLASAIKKNIDLAEVWKDLEDSGEADLNNNENVLDLLIEVPAINNNFASWFDKLSVEQVNKLWTNTELQKAIKNRLRYPGGLHEWCMVCRAPTFKEWGVTVDEIHAFRTKTKDLVWIHPDDGKPGGHDNSAPGGKHGSTKFHNELKSIIDNSSSLTEFNTKLEKLRIRWKINKSLLPPLL
jgi:hypothetical protein